MKITILRDVVKKKKKTKNKKQSNRQLSARFWNFNDLVSKTFKFQDLPARSWIFKIVPEGCWVIGTLLSTWQLTSPPSFSVPGSFSISVSFTWTTSANLPMPKCWNEISSTKLQVSWEAFFVWLTRSVKATLRYRLRNGESVTWFTVRLGSSFRSPSPGSGEKSMQVGTQGPTKCVCVTDRYFIVSVLDLPFASPITIYR